MLVAEHGLQANIYYFIDLFVHMITDFNYLFQLKRFSATVLIMVSSTVVVLGHAVMDFNVIDSIRGIIVTIGL